MNTQVLFVIVERVGDMNKILHYIVIFFIGTFIGSLLDPLVNPTPVNWVIAFIGLAFAVGMQYDFNDKEKSK